MRIKIALASTSAIFLTMWVVLAFTTPFFIIIEILSIISLFGSVLFLLETRKVLPRWYMAIPLCVSLSLLAMLTLWIYIGGGRLGPVGTLDLWIILLALLPLCSAMIFLSLKERSGSMDTYIAVSSAVSVLSIFSLFFAYREISKWSTIFSLITAWNISEWSTIGSAQLPLTLYWTVLMPIIGICFLVRAITYKNPGNILAR